MGKGVYLNCVAFRLSFPGQKGLLHKHDFRSYVRGMIEQGLHRLSRDASRVSRGMQG